MAAGQGLQVQRKKLTATNMHSHSQFNSLPFKSNAENRNDAVRELIALENYS